MIPLYAVGVFTSFTISQSGMVRHHLKERRKGWKCRLVELSSAPRHLHLAAVVIISKFVIGAWIIVVAIP